MAAVAAAVVLAPDPDQRPDAAQPSQPPSNALGGLEGSVAPPSDLTGVREADNAVFRWDNPAPQEGDIYLWRSVTATSKGELVRTSEAEAVIPATGAQTCIEVQVPGPTDGPRSPRRCAPASTLAARWEHRHGDGPRIGHNKPLGSANTVLPR